MIESEQNEQYIGLLTSFFHKNPIGSALYDANGTLVAINMAMAARFSITKSEQFFITDLFSSEIITDEEKRKLKEGQKIHHSLPYNFSVEPLLPTGSGYILSLSDARILADEVLRKSGVTIYTFSFLRFNGCDRINCQRCFQFYGSDNKLLDQNKYICRSLTKLRHPEDKYDFFFLFNEIRNKKLPGMKVNFRLKNDDDNSYRDFEINGIPFNLDEEGRPTLIAGCIIDDQLHVDKENELQNKREKAEEADRLKSAFLANMTHDIRTPLNAIVGFSELLSIETDLDLRENYSNLIRSNNELLLRLINDVLDLSKIESGQLSLSYAFVSLHDLMSEIYESMRLRIPAGITFVLEPLENYKLETDSSRLTQILQNLLTNAIKYTTRGTISLGYEIGDTFMKFHVTDTGRGVAHEDLEKIFNRFVQGKDHKAGSGLGLAICKGLVTQMGGRIGVESELGAGSTFYFTLPVSKSTQS